MWINCIAKLQETNHKNGSFKIGKKDKGVKIPSLASIITDEVKHQVELVATEPNLSALWNIKFYSKYGRGGKYNLLMVL